MKISIVGTGYVGLVTGTCFAEMGNKVFCVDTDKSKIENLKNGIIPIYEPGLSEMVKKNHEDKNLYFTTAIEEALQNTEVCFIAVGTPMDEDGSADLKYVLQVAKEIGMHIKHNMIIVNKSTVPVGTADRVAAVIQEQLDLRGESYNFKVVSNPEFLKEGSAVEDCMRPDRVVIGAKDEETFEVMKQLYSAFVRNSDRFIVMDVKSAEMTKYASNAMLATRISFMNEMANICEKVGADVNMVRVGMGSDNRIGYSFLYAGCGYGGSCFPKDVQALIKIANDNDYCADILESVEKVNKEQKMLLVKKIIKRFGEDLKGKTFGLWGLAFKPNTDDMRQATSIVVVNELVKRGAVVKAYDPKAVDAAKNIFGENDSIEYVNSKYKAVDGVDALVLVTEWKEFRSPDFDEIKKAMKDPIVFDGRNQYNDKIMSKIGFEYYRIGK
ncbi:MAG: UDP-glucose/GDP-mannose dehydrogenase family protein [Lachnospiraceae bacterium]|nr:UDP-glucose/GDP-mannose dehydrogenase family protein [Lachnospiraceae bacterium]